MRKKLFSAFVFFLSAVALIGCEKPAPTPDVKSDYTINATHGNGEYIYNSLNEGLANYYIILSEMEVSDDLKGFAKPGQALAIDLYAKADESMLPPVGTYHFTFDELELSEFTMSIYTNLLIIGSSLDVIPAEFIDATLVVDREGDVYTLTFDGKTLEDDKSVHCVYKGKLTMREAKNNVDDMFPPLVDNVSATFIDHRANYLGKNADDLGQFKLRFFSFTHDGSAHPGAELTLDLYSTIVNDELIPAAGKYTIATQPAAGTMAPGVVDVDKLLNLGTNCVFTSVIGDDYDVTYGMINAGSVDIAVNQGVFTVTADLITDNGKTIKGQYVGEIKVVDRSYYSTLKGDKEVILGDMPCEVEYYGQSLKNNGIDGDNWMIYITSGETGSDGLQVNLVTPVGKYADRLPLGEYEVTKQYATGDYICLPGEYDAVEGGLYCSWYVGDLAPGGMASEIAPFRGEGFIYVDKTEGLYSIIGEVYDDFPKTPNAIFVMWEGEISKYTDFSKEKANTATPYLFKTNVKPKVQVLHNEFVPAAQIKGQSYTNTLLRRTLLAR